MIPGYPIAGTRGFRAEAARARAAGEAEEEAMTPDTAALVAAEWEFKIIRSAARQFGNREVRDHTIAAEARAGWVLVEVFDDARIRLKRPRPIGPTEAVEEFDPYRTQIPYYPVPPTPAQKEAGRLFLVGLLAAGAVALLYVAGVLR
jgi:hypothetical protein